MTENGNQRVRHLITALLVLLFAVLAARDIGRPFQGLHSWEDANAAWSARSHLTYGLGYTHGFPTLAVGIPPPATPPRYLDHPPLPALLDAGAMALFGRHEWSLRLAALLLTAACLPLLVAILRRLYDDATALLATLLYVLFPITDYFYAAPTMWSWMLPFIFGSWWCYLVLIGGLREGPIPGARHRWALAVCLFFTIQLGWLGVFYAAGMGSHYLIRCLRLRRPPDLGLFAILSLVPLASFALDIGLLLAARGWDVKALIGLFTWRSSVTGERARTLAPWFARQWELLQSNFSLPVLIFAAGYAVSLIVRAFRSRSSRDGDGAPRPAPHPFAHAWLFFFPGLSYMAVFREQFWVHHMVYIPLSVPLAVASALGLRSLWDFLAPKSRAAADAVMCGAIALTLGCCAHALNLYHGARWVSPVEVQIMKTLNLRMAPDESLLSYAEYWVADNPYKLTHIRPEIAWYLDRSINAVQSLADLDRVLSSPSGKYPFYLVDTSQAPGDLVDALKARYPFEMFQGNRYDLGPPEIIGFADQLLFDLRGGRRDAPDTRDQAPVPAQSADQSAQAEVLMKSGLHALYEERDPAKASALFGQVLALNPRHYGATFQLAKALDQMGQREAARLVWQKVLALADGDHDIQTADLARKRLLENP